MCVCVCVCVCVSVSVPMSMSMSISISVSVSVSVSVPFVGGTLEGIRGGRLSTRGGKGSLKESVGDEHARREGKELLWECVKGREGRWAQWAMRVLAHVRGTS